MDDMDAPMTPRDRARQLGVDFDAVMAAHRRLRIGTVLVAVGYGALLGVGLSVATTLHGPAVGPATLLDLAMGFAVAIPVCIVPYLLVLVLVRVPPLAAAPTLVRELCGVVALSLAGTVALWGALTLVTVPLQAGLLFGYVVISSVMSQSGANQLAAAIRTGHPKLAEVIAYYRRVPGPTGLLDGTARWNISAFALGLLQTTGVGLLLSTMPMSIAVLAPTYAALTLVVSWAYFRRGRALSHAIAAVASIALVVAGVAAALA